MNPDDRYRWMHHHSQVGVTESLGFGTGDIRRPDDLALIRRALRAFRKSDPERFYPIDSMWRWIFEQKQGPLMPALSTGSDEEAAAILHSPHENYLYYGFEDLSCDSVSAYKEAGNRAGYAARCKDLLVRLAEALGLLKVENPESGCWGDNMMLPVEDLVSAIEKRAGAPLPLPDLHPGYGGLKMGCSLITDRTISAYYCAYRIKQLAGDQAKILEIGGGMGYVAYFSMLMGCQEFTIVDLPLTGLCQAYFLMRGLGPEKVVLTDEPAPSSGSFVRLVNADFLHTGGPLKQPVEQPVDLAVNIDGLPEYGMDAALTYLKAIRERAPKLLSINHEANPYRVRDLVDNLGAVKSYQRFPSWLRTGYVEEIVEF